MTRPYEYPAMILSVAIMTLTLLNPAHAAGDLAVGNLAVGNLAVGNLATGNLTLTKNGKLQISAPSGYPNPAVTTPQAQSTLTPVAALPTPTSQRPLPYIYQARTGRDPFIPPVEIRIPEAEDASHLPELQRYPIGDFTLIGIIWTKARKSAMVSTPDGKGHTVHPGTHIGAQGGKVRRITRDVVIIEEVRTDVFGERKKYETVLALRPEEVIP